MVKSESFMGKYTTRPRIAARRDLRRAPVLPPWWRDCAQRGAGHRTRDSVKANVLPKNASHGEKSWILVVLVDGLWLRVDVPGETPDTTPGGLLPGTLALTSNHQLSALRHQPL